MLEEQVFVVQRLTRSQGRDSLNGEFGILHTKACQVTYDASPLVALDTPTCNVC